MNSNISSEVNGFFGFTNIGDLLSQLVTAAIVIGAIALLIYFLWGGLNWLTSAGDKAKVETAQKTITNAVVGLIIIISAYALFQFITQFLGLGFLSQ